MNLSEYTNQDPVVRQPTGSVLLEPIDCQVWIYKLNTKGIYPITEIGIHIFQYPEASYRVCPDTGIVYVEKNNKMEGKSVFKIDITKLNSYT